MYNDIYINNELLPHGPYIKHWWISRLILNFPVIKDS